MGISKVPQVLYVAYRSTQRVRYISPYNYILCHDLYIYSIYVCKPLYCAVGSDLAPPPLPPSSVVIWRALLAGGLAGVVSRTSTAPLEKAKIIAQVSLVCWTHSHVRRISACIRIAEEGKE